MFSFFRKKPIESESAETPAALPAGRKEAASETSSAAPATGRPRTAAEWLNADVGELFFGKKPGRASAADIKDDAGAPGASTSGPASDAAPPAGQEDDRRDWLARLRTGLRRTGSSIAEVFVGATIDAAMYEDLEAALLQADAGAAATRFLLDDLQGRVTRADVRDPKVMRRLLADSVADLLAPLEKPLVIGEHVPTVIMVVGVNGAGKTTSVGKLARYLMDANQKVLLAAADTFRAAAREQLLAWAERADPGIGERAAAGVPTPSNRLEIVSQEGGDPAGLTFDAVVAAKARHCDVVIADTAGRLATQSHLMEELKKIRRTIGKAQSGAPHEVLLVIDGNTGQNALTQVQAFDAALDLTGLVITKLDGTAKGGVLAAIALWSRSRSAPLPVYFVGVGEQLADLQTFRAREFAEALVR
jgi:fused signal recognition particle receptor